MLPATDDCPLPSRQRRPSSGKACDAAARQPCTSRARRDGTDEILPPRPAVLFYDGVIDAASELCGIVEAAALLASTRPVHLKIAGAIRDRGAWLPCLIAARRAGGERAGLEVRYLGTPAGEKRRALEQDADISLSRCPQGGLAYRTATGEQGRLSGKADPRFVAEILSDHLAADPAALF